MENKVKITIEGDFATGKTVAQNLIAKALEKAGYSIERKVSKKKFEDRIIARGSYNTIKISTKQPRR